MELTITPKAQSFITRMMRFGGSTPGAGFRLALKPGGCAGYTYDFSVEQAPGPEDTVVHTSGLTIYVPQESVPYMNGMTIDAEDSIMRSGLVFIAPSSVKRCGCGTSVQIACGTSAQIAS